MNVEVESDVACLSEHHLGLGFVYATIQPRTLIVSRPGQPQFRLNLHPDSARIRSDSSSAVGDLQDN